MVQVLAGGFLVIHGLITTMIGVGGVSAPDKPALSLPTWFNWWPGTFGRSWLVDAAGIGTTGAIIGGVVWLLAGAALIAAGLGYLGVPVVRDQWPLLAVVGAVVGLAALGAYFHPIYLGAIAINVVLLVLAWPRVGSPA